MKPYTKTEPKICPYYGCGKVHTNWRSAYCCSTHQRRHSGAKGGHASNHTIMPDSTPLKTTRTKEVLFQKPFVFQKPKYSPSEKKALWCAYVVNRRKKRDKSMPAWANKDKINAIYLEARRLTEVTGIKHEVDHIIPSNHKLVSGLHCEQNLQILTRSENRIKSNNFSVS